jgi:hypothetical protein
MSNIVMSIQVKLKQLSKASQKNHQLMLTRYFQERLLFRLSISDYKNNFFLKGGALVYALERREFRMICILFMIKCFMLNKSSFKSIP